MKQRILLAIAVVTAVCVALGVWARGAAAVETMQWGLHFSQPGEAPKGNENPSKLAKNNGFYIGNTGEKVLYLTFDAGYENGCTEQILDVLAKHDVKAAFFLVGHYLERNADLVRRMVEEGHIVGNHTLHHPDMANVDQDTFTSELEGLEALFREITGKELPKYYRPPQGSYSPENLEQAASMGYTTVFWSLAYADWDNKNQPDPDAALEKLLGRTHNGAIVLLHSTSKTNAEILDRLLTAWEERGYRIAPISELGNTN